MKKKTEGKVKGMENKNLFLLLEEIKIKLIKMNDIIDDNEYNEYNDYHVDIMYGNVYYITSILKKIENQLKIRIKLEGK